MKNIVCCLFSVFLIFTNGRLWAAGMPPTQLKGGVEDNVKAYVKNYLDSQDPGSASDLSTHLIIAEEKNDNKKTELYIVYVISSNWCGSSGCTTLILEHKKKSFYLLGDLTIVQLPIRVLSKTHHGHPDIGVWVQGGGIRNGYEAILSFDGKKYPDNPTITPAKKVFSSLGRVVINISGYRTPLN